MEVSLEEFLVVAAILLLSFGHCFCVCGQAEYDINGECCPMCAPGNRVYQHCTEYTSTTCVPCAQSTYTAEPNGLPKCISCTVCDPGQGLRLKRHCTHISDTVCEALEGFYCMDQYKDSCRQAVEHATCSPGQYIKHKGTAVKDTICDGCVDGTYSNGTVDFCQPHLKCEDMGLTVLKPGTIFSDVVCGYGDKIILIVMVPLGVALGVAATGLVIWKRKANAGRYQFKDRRQTNTTELQTLQVHVSEMDRHQIQGIPIPVSTDLQDSNWKSP